MKTVWLLRSKAEHLQKDLQKKQCEEEENEFCSWADTGSSRNLMI